MKKIFIYISLVYLSLLHSEQYILILENQHYKNYIVEKELEENSQVPLPDPDSPADSIEVEGWTLTMSYGPIFYVSDSEWDDLIANMDTGLKLINEDNQVYAFISKDKLLNANCFKITDHPSLSRISENGYRLFTQETEGCGRSGGDYNMLRLGTGSKRVFYNLTNYWELNC